MKRYNHTLYHHLVVLVAAIIVVDFVAFGMFSSRKQLDDFQSIIIDNMVGTTKNLADSCVRYLLIADYAGLDVLLGKFIEIPEVNQIQVWRIDGKIVSMASKTNAESSPQQSLIGETRPVPDNTAPQISILNNNLIISQPIVSGKVMGWVGIIYSLDSIRAINRDTWIATAVAAFIGILLSVICAMVLMFRSTYSLQRLSDFARNLANLKGEQITVKNKSREIQQLCQSLNYASADLYANEREIQELNAELQRKITELTATQQELVRKEKLSVLGQLAGSLSHEIRNPLGIINNAVYFLKNILSAPDATVTEYLDIIMTEVKNAQRLISDLLDFSRAKTPARSLVSVASLVTDILQKTDIPATIQIMTDIPAELPLLSIDSFQIGQVLQNLFTNAIQAMAEGGRLKIRVCLISGTCDLTETNYHRNNPNQIEITVEDTGAGISPENLDKLFHPLFTTKQKGIGLGLVICKNLVEANDGQITVASQIGHGTTFTIIFPLASSPETGNN